MKCIEGDIRLVGGSNEREGIVEICQNNVFGYMCSGTSGLLQWGFTNASSVCTQLGYVGNSEKFVMLYLMCSD